MIGPEALKALEEGAHYAAILAAVDHAHVADDKDELHRLLDNVDPIEARLTANKLLVIHAFHTQDRGGTTDDSETHQPGGCSDNPSSITATDGWPTAPSIYPQVTHIGDNWSRKVPCR